MTEEILTALIKGTPYTVALTLTSFVLGSLLAVPICAMRISRNWFLAFFSTSYILTFRAIPAIVWLFLIFFGLGSGQLTMGPFVASSVALGMITAANMAEIYRGALLAIGRGQWEASSAIGLPALSRFFDVIAPQAVRIAIPASATFLIGLLKESAVASVIGVPELAFQAYQVSQQNFSGLGVYTFVALVYIALSLPIALKSRQLDAQLRMRAAR